MHRVVAAISAAFVAAFVVSPSGIDAKVARSNGLASKKSHVAPAEDPIPLLATLVQTHTDERVPLDDRLPSQERFSALLADRVTGAKIDMDPHLLDLLRSLSKKHPGARIELVSGYRSEKLNETLRKKGHHVAVHSQHTLGHAVDFRILPVGETRALSPLVIEATLRRELHWDGGVGVYLSDDDWFTHADVGPNRRWNGR